MTQTPGFMKEFSAPGDFAALNEAERFCKEHGLSFGVLCRDEPIGVKRGDFIIEKWRNLSVSEINAMDGTLSSRDFRNGPVTLGLLAPLEAKP